jgi:hypothetical protein
MNENLEQKIVSFVIGLFLGLLLGITIKYPVKLDAIEKYQTVCGPNNKIVEAKINITGDIYSISCANGIELKIH